MLTRSQESALDTTRSHAVIANAGSGKTSVLVQRFVGILLDHPEILPENIVAITFTEKAAAELQSKIAEKLSDIAHNTPYNERTRALRISAHAAFIGTIHSFCKRILRDYPLEADVDASFEQIESNESALLLQESVLAEFRAALDEKNAGYERFRNVFIRAGRSTLNSIVKNLADNREMWDAMESFYARTSEDIIERWELYLVNEKQKICDSFDILGLESFVRECLSGDKSGGNNSRHKTLSESLELCGKYKRTEKVKVEDKFNVLNELLNRLGTGTGHVNKKLVPKNIPVGSYDDIDEQVFRVKRRFSGFRFDESRKERIRSFEELLVATRVILELATGVIQRYDKKKESGGALDFDDLQLRAVRLLRDHADVRREVQQKYRYIMVDEFQDTNRLQYELIGLLTDNYTSVNAFIVGDPKQSIYSFRGAETEIFADVADGIVRAGGERHTFAESFRMLPRIADFVNFVFQRIMDASGYQTVVSARLVADKPVERSFGYVECIVPPREQKDGATEADHIAARILELVGENEQHVRVFDEATPRKPKYSDIAILLRARTSHLPDIEDSFLRHHIPFVVQGGIGFYDRQEIRDAIHYLRFIVNPDDDIALLGILRAPFFTISDTEIFAIAVDARDRNGERSFWERTRAYSHSPGASKQLKYAVERLQQDRRLAQRLAPTELLARITSASGWIGSIAGNPLFAQARANIEKFISLARTFQQRGFNSLFDFVAYFDSLSGTAVKEGQADTGYGGNAVRIMTIHAAKGLEFPIVFLPMTGKGSNSRNKSSAQTYFDTELGIAFTLNKEVPNEIYRAIHYRADERSKEEERRIFYVGCTRARDALFLSGIQSGEDSWLESVIRTTGIKANGETVELLAEDGSPFTVNVRTTLSPFATAAQSAREEGREIPGFDVNRSDIERILGESRGDYFSASHFVTHAQCPMKYALRYLLGAPEQFAPAQRTESDGDDRIYGSARGTIAHAALARGDFEGMNVTDNEALRALVEREVINVELDERRRGAIIEEIVAMIQHASATDEWKRVFSLPEYYCEYELSAVFGNHFIHGVIDRLYRDSLGTWHIVDYKTNRVDGATARLLEEQYRLQLKIYSYLVLACYPETSRVATCLFFLRKPSLSGEYITDRKEFAALHTEIEQRLDAILATRNDPRNAIKNRDHCPACAFFVGGACLADPRL